MTTAVPIEGECPKRFEGVRRAFEENFEARDEVGAAVAVYLKGQPIVDLWGGYADGARTMPWRRATIVNVNSTTKGMTAICAHVLVDRGQLDLDAPVARYWPEFANNGKEAIPVRWLLSHQAGLVLVREPLPSEAIYDPDRMAAVLAKERPCWEPGTKHGYHALTYGWLVGEVVRRVSGKTLGSFFRDEVAAPLEMDFHIGLSADHDGRVAEFIPSPPPPPDTARRLSEMYGRNSLFARAAGNPAFPRNLNTSEWRRAEVPAGNGHGTARALARVYGALALGGEVDGVRLLSAAAVERARAQQAAGIDAVLRFETRWGLGFWLTTSVQPMGPNAGAFGHPGGGGSLGFADPEAGVGFGYVMNQSKMEGLIADPRVRGLIDAVYAAL